MANRLLSCLTVLMLLGAASARADPPDPRILTTAKQNVFYLDGTGSAAAADLFQIIGKVDPLIHWIGFRVAIPTGSGVTVSGSDPLGYDGEGNAIYLATMYKSNCDPEYSNCNYPDWGPLRFSLTGSGTGTVGIELIEQFFNTDFNEEWQQPLWYDEDYTFTNASFLQASLDVLDAVDFLPKLASSGSAVLMQSGRKRLGVAADGAARLMLRIKSNTAGKATFTIAPGGTAKVNGSLYDPLSVRGDAPLRTITVPTSLVTPGGVHEAFAIYQAPEDFATADSSSIAMRTISISVKFNADHSKEKAVLLSRDVEVVRPPIVLVHGLWATPETWNTFARGLRSDFKNPGAFLKIVRADYSNTNAAHFDANRDVVGNAVDEANLAENGALIASARPDVIGHSMGGVLSRIWATGQTDASHPFYSAGNYNQGAIHKLITIDSPHFGSFRADQLTGIRDAIKSVNPNGYQAFVNAFAVAGKSIIDGAVDDMRTDSPATALMNRQKSDVPSHAIASNDNSLARCGPDLLKPLSAIPNLLGLPINFGVPPAYTKPDTSDVIVELSSQLGGLGARAVDPYYRRCHTNVLDYSVVSDSVFALLNASSSGLAFSRFPVTPPAATLAAPALLQVERHPSIKAKAAAK